MLTEAKFLKIIRNMIMNSAEYDDERQEYYWCEDSIMDVVDMIDDRMERLSLAKATKHDNVVDFPNARNKAYMDFDDE